MTEKQRKCRVGHMRPLIGRPTHWSLAVAAGVATVAAHATGATYYVAAGSTNSANPVDLSLAGSYTTNTAPGVNDVADISTANVSTGANYFTFDGGFAIGQLRVDLASGSAAGGSETITSANTLVLDGTGGALGVSTGGILLNSGTGATLAINANVQLGATQYFTESRALSITGGINLNGFNLYTDVAGSATTATFSGTIADGTGGTTTGLVDSGAGTLLLSGTNTYAGGTTLGSGGGATGGFVRVANNSALGTGTVTVAGNYTLGTTSGGPATTVSNPITINTGVNASFDGGYADLTLGGVIAGAGNLTKVSTGNVLITAANTYTGATNVTAGVLVVTAAGAALGGTTTALNVTTDAGNIVFGGAAANGTLEFATAANLGPATQVRFRNTSGTAGAGGDLLYVGTTNQTVTQQIENDSSIGIRLDSNSSGGSVTYNGSVFFPSAASARPLFLGGSGTGNNTFAIAYPNATGTILNPVTKLGTGKWTLSAANTYTGTTNVSNGTLVVTGSTAAGSAVTIGAAGTLAGTGNAYGTVTVNGTITGGSGATTSDMPGNLSTGSQTWNGSGAYVTKFSADNSLNDCLLMTGLTVSAGASGTATAFVVNVQGSAVASLSSNTYLLAVDTGTATAITNADPFVVGDLTLQVNGAAAPAGYTLSEAVDSGNGGGYDLDLVVTAAPEPTSLLLAAAAAAPLALGRRRRVGLRAK
jgi:fibronectin-binding autotransporter adhesin